MVVWTDYMRYRAKLRGFDLEKLEQIVTHSAEHYYDIETGRTVVIGRYDTQLVILPYEMAADVITPITVHTTTRQQINFRLKAGRFINE
ncbi:MAG: hypothetical protein KC423_00500 [Anaerolineales bacterium]|nr:hypothetical protein [Anaerolineales bacterium]